MILVSDKFKDITGKMFIFVKRSITQIFCIERDFWVFLRGNCYLPNGLIYTDGQSGSYI